MNILNEQATAELLLKIQKLSRLKLEDLFMEKNEEVESLKLELNGLKLDPPVIYRDRYSHKPGLDAIRESIQDSVRKANLPHPSLWQRLFGVATGSQEVEEAVISLIRRRRAQGRRKYGGRLDDSSKSHAELLRDLQEELLDAAIYLEAALRKED